MTDSARQGHADAIREVRGFTDLMRASIDQVLDEEAGRPVDRTAMIAWDATHGTYQFRGDSLESIQDQISRFVEAKSMAASVLVAQMALWVASLESEMSVKDVLNEVERRAIAMISSREDSAS